MKKKKVKELSLLPKRPPSILFNGHRRWRGLGLNFTTQLHLVKECVDLYLYFLPRVAWRGTGRTSFFFRFYDIIIIIIYSKQKNVRLLNNTVSTVEGCIYIKI